MDPCTPTHRGARVRPRMSAIVPAGTRLDKTMKKPLLALVFLLSGMAYAVSPHTVTIGFSSVAGADQYYVYRGKSSGVCKAGAPYAVVTGGGSTSFTDSDVNLKDGQVVYYSVSSVTLGVESATCGGELKVTVPTTGYSPPTAAAAPAAPSGPTLTSST